MKTKTAKIKSILFKNNLLLYIVIIGIAAILLLLNQLGFVNRLTAGLFVPLCIYSILAVSLNLTVGILGELSLGHAGFMCIGAFFGAFTSVALVGVIESGFLRFLISLLIATIATAFFGIIIGIPVLRLKGDYLAIVTLAFGEIIKNIMNILFVGVDSNGIHIATSSKTLKLLDGGRTIIAGAQGISGTKNSYASTFLLGVILLLITLFVILNLINSRSGRAIMSIRDNRIAAESIGINITKYKLMAFSISAAFAGIAGVLYAHNLSTLTALPKNFGYNMSIMILVFVVLGGIGNMKGSIIAAVILSALPEYLRFLQEYRMLIYSLVLIIMMLFNWSPKAKVWKEEHSIKILYKKLFKKETIKEDK
jgi:branched-chain amino acid transport system permease protein